MNEHELGLGDPFGNVRTRTKALQEVHSSHLAYDLVGKVAQSTVLTRRTVVSILKNLREDKLYMFRNNPKEFIQRSFGSSMNRKPIPLWSTSLMTGLTGNTTVASLPLPEAPMTLILGFSRKQYFLDVMK